MFALLPNNIKMTHELHQKRKVIVHRSMSNTTNKRVVT